MSDLPKIFTLKDVLESYRGVCGRSYMLQRLKEIPEIGGEPTHRYLGNKIVFFEEDLPRLRECLTTRPRSAQGKASPAEPSAEERYLRALRLVKSMAAGTKKAKQRTAAR